MESSLFRVGSLSYVPVLLCSVGALLAACGAGSSGEELSGSGGTSSGDGDQSGDGGSAPGDGDGDLNVGCMTEANCPTEAMCGDSILGEAEACDDGNDEAGDGCSADCSEVEEGFICPGAGVECRPFVRCGDGVVTTPEQCDDGGTESEDGCSDRCRVELNSKCSGEPSECSPTTCGDEMKEGTEGCDDGNTLPGDGCGIACQVEPTCDENGCTSECGDGLLLDEDCDDGNLTDGDGCSADCAVETGAMCENAACETIGEQCIVRVPVIYRDFDAAHIDFQNTDVGCEGLSTGALDDELGEDGKPVFVGSASTNVKPCINSFSDWYNDVPSNKTLQGELLLFENGTGGYVNRWKDDGTQLMSLGDPPAPKDGQPFFFPIDNHPDALTLVGDYHTATVNEEYADTTEFGTWTAESHWVTPAPVHNFHFTSEVKYWFRYDATEVASLNFLGDDDVWVFINGKLALDLGGLHAPLGGSVTVSSATASTYNLVDGKVYPITIFHAERKRDGSSFQLTLTGLSMGRSNCFSDCGDGIIGPDEECDDGENDGGYNECQEECRLGGYCGDGVKQEEEECDYRAPDAPATCGTGCTIFDVR